MVESPRRMDIAAKAVDDKTTMVNGNGHVNDGFCSDFEGNFHARGANNGGRGDL
jgi:hypothetical protein